MDKENLQLSVDLYIDNILSYIRAKAADAETNKAEWGYLLTQLECLKNYWKNLLKKEN